MKIYVASSWRNEHQAAIVQLLRARGHDTYDFKQAESAFSWKSVHPAGSPWTGDALVRAVSSPVAQHGFDSDIRALRECDACVLVLPAGRSAHLETGWAIGAGKSVAVYVPREVEIEPELMYCAAELFTTNLNELYRWASEDGVI